MSPDTIIALAIQAVVGVLALGGMWVKVHRLERDVGECVRREVYAAEMKPLNEKLSRVESLVERIYDRFASRREESGPQPRAPRD